MPGLMLCVPIGTAWPRRAAELSSGSPQLPRQPPLMFPAPITSSITTALRANTAVTQARLDNPKVFVTYGTFLTLVKSDVEHTGSCIRPPDTGCVAWIISNHQKPRCSFKFPSLVWKFIKEKN